MSYVGDYHIATTRSAIVISQPTRLEKVGLKGLLKGGPRLILTCL